MLVSSLDTAIPTALWRNKFSPSLLLGGLVGILMPLLSGMIFPTYYHILATPWLEWTKLLEAPFLLSEMLVICLAIYRGMEIKDYIDPLSKDMKIASGLFIVGLLYSSLFVSQVPVTSLAISIGTILHILFGFSIFHFFKNTEIRHFTPFWFCLGIGLVLLALYTAWRFLWPIPASEVPGGKIEWGFSLPGFISVRYFGTWTGAITTFFLALVIQRGEKTKPSWPDLFLLIAMSMTIWSGTRAAVLGIVFAFTAMFLLKKRWPSFALMGRISITTGLAAIIAWMLIPYGESDFQLFSSEHVKGVGAFTSGRTELWIATYQKWLEAPFFGWGSGSIFWEVFLGWTHTQPHNAFLQFLISWGLVGAIGTCWLLGRVIVTAQRKTYANPDLWPFMAMFYSLLAMSMVDGALYYPRFIMLVMLCLAVILSDRRDNSGPTLITRTAI